MLEVLLTVETALQEEEITMVRAQEDLKQELEEEIEGLTLDMDLLDLAEHWLLI